MCPLVQGAVRAAGEVFRELGATLENAPFNEAREAVELNPRGLVIAAEAYHLNQALIEQHAAELDPAVAPRMLAGREVTAEEYLATSRGWQQLRVKARRRLADVDALLCPTTAIPAPLVAEVDLDGETYSRTNLLLLRNTAIGNILDLCAVSVPCGFTSQGFPIGLMIYGKPFDEATVLRVAHAYQKVTSWHRKRPNLDWIAA